MRTNLGAMTQTSQAGEALAEVLARVPPPGEDNDNFQVLDSWTEGHDTICIVYRGWWEQDTLGLRREIDADQPLSRVVGQILDAELGEPPGRLIDGVEPDESGIVWWRGEPREWWSK